MLFFCLLNISTLNKFIPPICVERYALHLKLTYHTYLKNQRDWSSRQ
jgi:hypothetical protein